MNKLAVLEASGGNIGELINERLLKLKDSGAFIPTSVSGLPSFENGLKPDLLIIPACAERRGVSVPPTGSCGILLMPGSIDAPDGLKTAKVVSYGMSGKCCVTLSSIGETRSMLTIRREVPTLGGAILERQELPVRHKLRAEPEDTIAFSAALLILGVSPDMLL